MEIQISTNLVRDYCKILFLSYLYILILRSLETIWVAQNHIVENSVLNELAGLVTDFFLVNALSVLFFLIQYLSRKTCRKFFNTLIITILVLLSFLHVLFLKYYVYELKPVDQFLFTYSLKEVLFTISTSDVSYLAVIISIILFISIAIFFTRFFNRISCEIRIIRWLSVIILVSIPLCFYSIWKTDNDANDIRKYIRTNKSLYFYRHTFNYLIHRDKTTGISPEDIRTFQSQFPGKEYLTDQYPFLHKQHLVDNTGDFFNTSDTLPNIVILIVEGLGERFMQSFHGIRLMPFLDSLSDKSLYWDRFFTTGERSFAVIPSLTGSLPYGEKGFLLMDNLPKHITMISLLKRHGYNTHFFYGQGAWFHKKDRFFKTNDIDLILEREDFSPKYEKVMALGGTFFTGYKDMDLFSQSLEILDTLPSTPRIDLYFTGSMHSPFPTGNPELYYKMLNKISAQSNLNKEDQKYIDKYRKYLISVLYFDHSLEQFMKDYAKRDDFDNTIFIITGDHPITEIPIASSIKRYQVPLIIWSPMLKRSKRIHATGSHLDIYPTLLAFLKERYAIPVPDESVNLGYCLDTLKDFCQKHPIPFMNDNREIIDYLKNGYFLSRGERIFQVDADLNLIPVNNPDKMTCMVNNLDAFNQVNLWSCMNDRIIPDSIYFRDLCYKNIFARSTKYIEIPDSIEFVTMYPQVTVEGTSRLYFEFSGTIAEFDTDNTPPIGVIQIINGSDSTLTWKSFNLVYTENRRTGRSIHYHLKIDPEKFPDSIFHVKSYFWNGENGYAKIENIEAKLYQQAGCY